MSYAESLPDVIAAYQAEMRKCDEQRRVMWAEFVERIRMESLGRPGQEGR